MTEGHGVSASRKRELLTAELARRRTTATLSIPRRTGAGLAPLSFSQQRIWFLQQWTPGAPTFNGARAFRLRGRLDVDALRRALVGVVERHESLRTVFLLEGREPGQLPLEEWSLDVPVLDLAGRAEPDREAELRRRLRALSREPFDLAADVTLRATVVRLGPEEHILLLGLHHISGDAFSDGVLFRELGELYEAAATGRPPALRPLPIQYADFAVWQRARLSGELLDRLVSYWTDQLSGAPELLPLPTDRPRPQVQRHEGAHRELLLPPRLASQVAELARAERATVFMALLAAFATLLYRLTGEEDVVVGSPIANRVAAELEGLIGFFSNTVALRTRLAGNPSFREVLRRARETTLGALAHQELPFEQVVQALRVRRDPAYNPLFQTNFRAEAAPRPALALHGLAAEPIAIDIGLSRFDLALELRLEPAGLRGFVEYNRDLFEQETIATLAEDYEALLASALAAPDTPVLALELPHGRRAAAQRRRAQALPGAHALRRQHVHARDGGGS